MIKKETIYLSILMLISISGLAQEPQISSVFPAWEEGYLDIHHINTGKGESTFFILPDGTTLLVDAGATQRPKPRVTDPKPNDSLTPGEWIARYIKHVMQGLPGENIDYALLSHFHYDHIGELYPEVKSSKNGTYKLAGISEVAEHVSINKLVDRDWPSYDYPKPATVDYMKNYIQFVNTSVDKRGMTAEQFKVGVSDQFALINEPEKYPNFEIRNIAANGQVWTGTGTNKRNHFPPMESIDESDYPDENLCSTAFRLSYGAFDYYSGGDLLARKLGHWKDIETPVGLATGPVDVCLANHHAYYDAMSESFLQAVRPRVHIIHAWAPSHPSPSVLRRMSSTAIYPGPRDIFSTNIMDATRVVIGAGLDELKSQQGHIVVRVNPGGESYLIYILDDSEESFKITSIHGPYFSN
ncbi:ComEC/Rec2 family competence protein [Cyclobacterium qasimii]|nr:MBL fold metallo-hydrolase [Cyclobacterium qasimii]